MNELKSTYSVLGADFDAALAIIKEQDDSQFARRTLVRTLFAFVEGLNNQLASVAAASEVGLSGGELAALREETYEVNDKGEVVIRSARISLKRRIRLVLRCFPRIHGASFQPDFGGQGGWESLHEAIRVRDRLTHPKAGADLHVSESDIIKHVAGAFRWYKSTIVGLLKACQDADSTGDHHISSCPCRAYTMRCSRRRGSLSPFQAFMAGAADLGAEHTWRLYGE